MSYRVETIIFPREDDPIFEEYIEAIDMAKDLRFKDDFIGVRDIGTGNLEAIVYGQRVFVLEEDILEE